MEELPKNILGIQRTANVKELAGIYSESDVFLNLSYCENYPTVNLESRACGTPVITYRTGGSPESAGEDGVVVEQGNIQELIREIKNIRIKGTKLEMDTSKFDSQITTDMYVKLYNI
jgi:glycosyltransferase involved in cell wall biosynthesis